ncbi:MAG: protein kinase, partial [Planctomycetaceae bacterium]|nr:protein kinase [Planctomycetaceae bacterium]
VLIDEQGMPHVTDFGVSKSLTANCDLTSSGEVIGTPHYMPPEQAGGQGGEIQPASDVYSIGAILYAMLTGRPPFQAATPIEVISQVLTQDPVPTKALNPSVPIDLEVITLKCLSKSIRHRYANAVSLSDDLRRYLRGEPILAKPPGLARRLLFFVRRHVVWASVSGTAAMALVLLTGVVAVSYFRARSQILDLKDNLAIAQNR